MVESSWIEDYQRRVREIGARAERVHCALREVSATVTAGAGAVTVTVCAEGVLARISFGPRADELSRPMLAEVIQDATRLARADAARRAGDVLGGLVGDTEAGRFVASHHPEGAR
ncbi:MAG TPA: YbaB/EbfC family nucleoid-associated protein [Pseudonocardia sp.]|jgi:DNA-binding protein YbaB|nr:YbaB/EbfC family nucleoid-associated protein [Pseudonocardia sp.]